MSVIGSIIAASQKYKERARAVTGWPTWSAKVRNGGRGGGGVNPQCCRPPSRLRTFHVVFIYHTRGFFFGNSKEDSCGLCNENGRNEIGQEDRLSLSPPPQNSLALSLTHTHTYSLLTCHIATFDRQCHTRAHFFFFRETHPLRLPRKQLLLLRANVIVFLLLLLWQNEAR